MERNRIKIGVFTLTALLIAFCVSLCVGEIALRIIKPKSLYTSARILPPMYLPDEMLGWKLIPGFEGTCSTDEFDTRIRVNAAGFRDREFPTVPDSSVFRILGLGDSFTFGFGIDADKTYLRQLELLLNNRKTGVPVTRIYNTGVPGYSIREESIVFDRIRQSVKPDLITIGFDINDHTDCSNAKPKYRVVNGYVVSGHKDVKKGPEPHTPPRLRMLLHRYSYLYAFLSRAKRVVAASLPFTAAYKEAESVTEKAYDPEKQTAALACAEKYLDNICVTARTAGIPVVIMFIPHRSQIHPDHKNNRYTDQRYFDGLDRYLAEYCRNKDLLYVNMLPHMLATATAENPLYHMTTDAHWNAAGHKLAAEKMYEVLTAGIPALSGTTLR